MVVDQLLVHGVDGGEDPGEAVVTSDDTVQHWLNVAREDVSVLNHRQTHVGGQVTRQILVTWTNQPIRDEHNIVSTNQR